MPINPGFTLKYTHPNSDIKKIHSDTKHPKSDLFERVFNQTGAVVLRYNLGHRQRAACLQQCTEQAYEQNPIENIGPGKDQKEEFPCPAYQDIIKDNIFLPLLHTLH